MRFHEYVARLLGYRRTGETGRKEKEKLQPEVAWWMERTEIARVCGRERPRSGIIYGPTRKVRKICTGFAETTLLYATDLNTAQFREPEGGRCLWVFQPGYVLHSLSTTDNPDRVQTRKDLFFFFIAFVGQISQVNDMLEIQAHFSCTYTHRLLKINRNLNKVYCNNNLYTFVNSRQIPQLSLQYCIS